MLPAAVRNCGQGAAASWQAACWGAGEVVARTDVAAPAACLATLCHSMRLRQVVISCGRADTLRSLPCM